MRLGTTSELPIRLVRIPNWLEILIRIARNYQHSKLPILEFSTETPNANPGMGYGMG